MTEKQAMLWCRWFARWALPYAPEIPDTVRRWIESDDPDAPVTQELTSFGSGFIKFYFKSYSAAKMAIWNACPCSSHDLSDSYWHKMLEATANRVFLLFESGPDKRAHLRMVIEMLEIHFDPDHWENKLTHEMQRRGVCPQCPDP